MSNYTQFDYWKAAYQVAREFPIRYWYMGDAFSFWDFIETIRKHGLKPSSHDLVKAYHIYFTDYPEEKGRVSDEIQAWFDQVFEKSDRWLKGYFAEWNSLDGDINAAQRIKQSAYQMLQPMNNTMITDESFNEYWNKRSKQPMWILPEDDVLDTHHLFERVHIIVCDFHQELFD